MERSLPSLVMVWLLEAVGGLCFGGENPYAAQCGLCLGAAAGRVPRRVLCDVPCCASRRAAGAQPQTSPPLAASPAIRKAGGAFKRTFHSWVARRGFLDLGVWVGLGTLFREVIQRRGLTAGLGNLFRGVARQLDYGAPLVPVAL